MISVVFSTRKGKPDFIEHLKKTSGVHKLEVIQIINDGEMSLTEAYNKGLKDSQNNIIVSGHTLTLYVSPTAGTMGNQLRHSTGDTVNRTVDQ